MIQLAGGGGRVGPPEELPVNAAFVLHLSPALEVKLHFSICVHEDPELKATAGFHSGTAGTRHTMPLHNCCQRDAGQRLFAANPPNSRL